MIVHVLQAGQATTQCSIDAGCTRQALQDLVHEPDQLHVAGRDGHAHFHGGILRDAAGWLFQSIHAWKLIFE
jgi:hypothetical protein